jgi:hypothetical protein
MVHLWTRLPFVIFNRFLRLLLDGLTVFATIGKGRRDL